MKRTGALFFLAVISFFVFSYIDEYENLILPLIGTEKDSYASLFREEKREETVKAFLTGYNRALSEAYLSPDTSRISQLPASEEVKRALHEEIAFLKGKGLTMEYSVDSMDVIEIKRLSVVATQVKAKEKVSIGYRSNNAPLSPYSVMENEVTYTLIAGPEGLMVAGVEVVPFKGAKKDKGGR